MNPTTNKYRVTFPQHPEWNALYKIILHDSASFHYGNQTCVTVHRNGEFLRSCDTRYVKGIKTNFDQYCEQLLNDEFNPELTFTIERILD